jgi:tRNA A-37 threonylcarbamoyl transferase component Bud32
MRRQNKMTKEEFEKTLSFIKHNVEECEYRIHKIIYNSEIVSVPKIYRYDKRNKIMVMQKIFNMSIADEYGEDPANVPHHMFTLMQDIIRKLYYAGIEYPDITGYNFIFYNNKMYLRNFKYCRIFTNTTMKDVDPFIIKFINGLCEWNPDYK